MAGRLISPPVGLALTSVEPLSGPRSVGAGASQSIGGFVQTVSAPFGLWRFRFSFRAQRDSEFRRYRGWVTAMHGGANATRFNFIDPDMLKANDVGVEKSDGENWSDEQPWANGEPWDYTLPNVALSESASADASSISLSGAFWGHELQPGDYLGFFPFYFGLHMVTEAQGDGIYRIWPPLRKALTTDDYATLYPVMAMRLESEDAANAGRGLVVADSLQATLVEVLDPDVREYFEG